MRDLESNLSKLIPLVLVFFTSCVAISIISIRGQRATGSVYAFFLSSPDTIGLVIQILSAALGACQVFAITSIINLTSRLHMQHGTPVEFRRLKLLAAVTSGSSQALRTSLPGTWLAIVALAMIALKTPAALWAGALTPVFADYVTEQGLIPVPTYPESAVPYWQSSFRRLSDGTVDMSSNCTSTITGDQMLAGSVALVSTCPAVDLISALVGSLSTAAAGTPKTPRPHPRIDSSGWTTLGRSFGVGSSPGIMALQNLEKRQAPLLAFNYTEIGYYANLTCTYNATSNYTISSTEDESGIPSYFVTGTLPNSVPGHIEEYALASATSANNFIAWSALANAGQNMLAIAATGQYSQFDKMQCIIDFEPTQFLIHVNATNNFIAAHLPMPFTKAKDIEPTGQFTTSVLYGLEQISRMSGSTLASTLGTPISHNMVVIAERNPDLDSRAAAALNLEYCIGTVLENLLIAHAQSQMLNLKNFTTTPLIVQYRALRVGSDRYIYAVLLTNCFVLLAALFEAGRTRLWRGLVAFDVSDIQSMAVGASIGGTAIAEKCESGWHMGINPDRIAVRLVVQGGRWALVPANRPLVMYAIDEQPDYVHKQNPEAWTVTKPQEAVTTSKSDGGTVLVRQPTGWF